MIEKVKRLIDSLNGTDPSRSPALDHDYRKPEFAGGGNLAIGRAATTVLGDNDVDPVSSQKLLLGFFPKGAGRKNIAGIGNGERWHDCIDAADDIGVLRRVLEMGNLLPADREEYASGGVTEDGHCLGNGRNAGPAISGHRLPGRAAQREAGYAGLFCRDESVVRNPRRKGMGRIDQQVEMLLPQECGKTVAATETAAPDGHGLGHWVRRSPRQRERGVAIPPAGQRAGEVPRFGGSAKDQDTVLAHA